MIARIVCYLTHHGSETEERVHGPGATGVITIRITHRCLTCGRKLREPRR